MNVIAKMKGSELPDEWVIRGNHHDGWVNGASDPISGLVAEMDGSISAEHGIGKLNRESLVKVKDPVALELMRGLKQMLEPNGILNPGKMFDVFRVWKHPRMDVHLPWDHK